MYTCFCHGKKEQLCKSLKQILLHRGFILHARYMIQHCTKYWQTFLNAADQKLHAVNYSEIGNINYF
jgi:hypothetical protein